MVVTESGAAGRERIARGGRFVLRPPRAGRRCGWRPWLAWGRDVLKPQNEARAPSR
jgi:hypothetical protein